MRFTVRRATAADARAMGEIHVAAWRAAYAGVMDAGFLAGLDAGRVASWWRETLAGRPGDPVPWAHLVAEREGRVVAMATVGPARDSDPELPAAQLWMLNAHPDVFGTGVAAALHNEALATIRARGCDGAYLWVARDNPRARRFYERQRWVADGAEMTDILGGAEVAEVRYVRATPRPPAP